MPPSDFPFNSDQADAMREGHTHSPPTGSSEGQREKLLNEGERLRTAYRDSEPIDRVQAGDRWRSWLVANGQALLLAAQKVEQLTQERDEALAARDGAREALLLTAKAGNDAAEQLRLRNQTMREALEVIFGSTSEIATREGARAALSESAEPEGGQAE